MKHYLLTWYGMTDLRAALGLEESDGPILSALKTGEYSDVVILAYSNPVKPQHFFEGEVYEEWEEWVTTPLLARQSLSRDQTDRYVDAASNTAAGHTIFADWLRGQLTNLGIVVNIRLVPQELRKLNDAMGIIAASSAAVKIALEDPDEKQLTTYVSPGTPVMAYTWALIARSNPQLKIGVISSSDPRMPPERVDLPKALLNSSVQSPSTTSSSDHNYELVIHLLGEQSIPVYFGMKQFEAQKHLIITTSEYEKKARDLLKLVDARTSPIVISDAYRPADTRIAITKQVKKLSEGSAVAVNLTGGTKLMFAGALQACWDNGLDPFYFEMNNHNVIFLRDGVKVPFKGVDDVEELVKVSNFSIFSPGRSPQQTDPHDQINLIASEKMWSNRKALRGLYGDKSFRDFSKNWNASRERPEGTRQELKVNWSNGELVVKKDGSTQILLQGTEMVVPNEESFEFVRGGWLEDYVYSLLLPLQEEGLIHDLRIGLEVGYKPDPLQEKKWPVQEFDCAFTDGKRLWIVECKAGLIQQEAIQKLENNLRNYGGIASRGLLVSAQHLRQPELERLTNLKSIKAVTDTDLSTEALKKIIRRPNS